MTKIILICGPSGAGKDTLIKEAKEYFKDYKKVVFVKRYITRKPDKYEDNFYTCKRGFNILKESNFFLVHWENYENLYGIPKYFIKENCCNFISVSRTVVSFFESQFSNVHTILITAGLDTIVNRLKKRNRENGKLIEQRLKRYHLNFEAKNKIVFKNEGPYNVVKENFISLCLGFISDYIP